MEIEPVPQLRPAHEVDPAHIPALKADVERLIAAKERRMLDLCNLTFTASGPAAGSSEVRAVLDELQCLFAALEPEVLVVGSKRNRVERRRDAARHRRQA